MINQIVRLFAFFGKEFNEIRRQPQLLLSMLLGPVLILVLVGVAYRGERTELRIGLIVPEAIKEDERFDATLTLLQENFDVVEVVGQDVSFEEAQQATGADVIERIPADYAEKLERGEPVDVEFSYDVIDPQFEQYIRYAAFRQIDEINNQLLLDGIEAAQSDVDTAVDDLESAQTTLDSLDSLANEGEIDDALELVRRVRGAVTLLQVASVIEQDEQTEDLLNELNRLEDLLQSANSDGALEQLDDLSSNLDAFINDLGEIEGRSPSAVVAPLRPAHNNVAETSVDLVTFFAPAVAAFVLQHIGVTLGSLSLVRERMRGTREFYAAAPISIMEVLVGKYLAYLLFMIITAAVLFVVLVTLLGVPFMGNGWALVGIILLFLMASIGYGFVISVVSGSDVQAVQSAMLVLLFAVFFSGFMLPTAYFTEPLRYAGLALPVTHAINGLQQIMLRGELPTPTTWAVLGGMAVVSFIAVSLLWNRSTRPGAHEH